MVLAVVGGGLYNTVLTLHILSVIFGFGPVVLNGIYASQAKQRGGPEAGAIMQANYFVTNAVAEKIIYTVPVWGIFLVILSDKAYPFSEAWVSLSFLLYLIGLGIAHGLMRPTSKRMLELGAGDSGDRARLEQRLVVGGTVLNLLLVVVVVLMIFKPGA